MEQFDEITEEIIRQNNWSEEELKAKGYQYFERKKSVVMARKLPDDEAPKTIVTSQGDELIAQEGYIICYHAGDEVYDSLEKYDHWPVAPTIFAKTYKRWETDSFVPTPSQKKLMMLGCMPYYKFVGVWAKKLDKDGLLQSLEHGEPVRVETGKYVAIGSDGEPYSMGENTLHSRYQAARGRFGKWFKRLFNNK